MRRNSASATTVASSSSSFLPADFHARCGLIQIVCGAGPCIYNHNIEMVERLTRAIRAARRVVRTFAPDAVLVIRELVPEGGLHPLMCRFRVHEELL